MDDIDRSVAEQEFLARATTRTRKPDGPDAAGNCLNPNCEEPLPHPERWCDRDCLDEYERLTALASR